MYKHLFPHHYFIKTQNDKLIFSFIFFYTFTFLYKSISFKLKIYKTFGTSTNSSNGLGGGILYSVSGVS